MGVKTLDLVVKLVLGLLIILPVSSVSAQAKSATLAIVWQTAFCETAERKRECVTQKPGRYDTRNFTLHGLWPGQTYCTKVPYRNVQDKIWSAMRIIMPGTASGLHRHEWRKHGTCYSKTPDRYYFDSVKLVLGFNKTAIRDLFLDHVGKYLSANEIRAAFNREFGRGAGDRVLVHCARDGKRTLIQELRINLNGDLSTANLPVLLKQARAQKRGCKGGIVDPVGFQ